MKKRLLLTTLPALATAALAAPAAVSASTTTNSAVSQNWAGYVAASASSKNFSSAEGSWVEPSVKCSSGNATYSAYWVGLGGGSSSSDALEQEGTQADCSASGQATHYAWYELVPSAPVKLAMTVSPGDHMYAKTSVSGNQVTVEVDNKTTGQSFKKTLTMSTTPDTSTAEWIAEAPSECQSSSLENCQVLSLANFGSVKFTGASATADGHTGSISDSKFTTTAVGLSNSSSSMGGGYGGYGYSGGPSSSSSSGGSSGYSSSGYGSSGYGSDGSSGYGSDGWGDSGYGSMGAGGFGGMSGFGFGTIKHAGVIADTSLVSSAGSAAPSSLSDNGSTFTVYYGKALSGATGTSLTGSSGSDSSSGSATSGYGSDGWGSDDGWGDSGYGWGDSGSSTSGYGSGSSTQSGSSSSDQSGSGSYSFSLGGQTITITI